MSLACVLIKMCQVLSYISILFFSFLYPIAKEYFNCVVDSIFMTTQEFSMISFCLYIQISG